MNQGLVEVRRVLTQIEDIEHEFGPAPQRLVRRGVVMAVLRNPYAGRYEADIVPMMDALNPVGVQMARRLLSALALPPQRIESYGKAAIVGAGGELEHGALWHVPGGYAMREVLGWQGDAASYRAGRAVAPTDGQPGNALAIVPSTKKVGGPSTRIDVPLTHINASYVRSHYDAIEVGVPGAPREDELVFILAMSTGGRVAPRLGGLTAEGISQWNGLR